MATKRELLEQNISLAEENLNLKRELEDSRAMRRFLQDSLRQTDRRIEAERLLATAHLKELRAAVEKGRKQVLNEIFGDSAPGPDVIETLKVRLNSTYGMVAREHGQPIREYTAGYLRVIQELVARGENPTAHLHILLKELEKRA